MLKEGLRHASEAPSLYVGKIMAQSGPLYVTNGFVPHWRSAFCSGEACCFVVEFDPSEAGQKGGVEDLNSGL